MEHRRHILWVIGMQGVHGVLRSHCRSEWNLTCVFHGRGSFFSPKLSLPRHLPCGIYNLYHWHICSTETVTFTECRYASKHDNPWYFDDINLYTPDQRLAKASQKSTNVNPTSTHCWTDIRPTSDQPGCHWTERQINVESVLQGRHKANFSPDACRILACYLDWHFVNRSWLLIQQNGEQYNHVLLYATFWILI